MTSLLPFFAYLNLMDPPRFITSINQLLMKCSLNPSYKRDLSLLSIPRNHQTTLRAPLSQPISIYWLVICVKQCIRNWGHKCKNYYILCVSRLLLSLYLFYLKCIINLKVVQHCNYMLFDVRVCVLPIFVFSIALVQNLKSLNLMATVILLLFQ